MAEPHPHFENFSGARHVRLGQQTVNLIAGNQYLANGNDLILRLNPITDASHTRNRATSPPNSECFPGTRRGVIKGITCWVNTRIVLGRRAAHIYWFHGFAGSGKSAISLEIARIYARSGRLVASYFFFRNQGDRSRMNRFAATLASQLAISVPAAAPFVEAALKDPGLLTDKVSLSTQMEQLVYGPFQAAVKGSLLVKTLARGPFLIVIDGLDECEDKDGVKEFIIHALDFFGRNPSIPLRILIASRVEQHIHAHLKNESVVVRDLDDHSPDNDVQTFLESSFQIAAKQNPVIQAYIHGHGSWPTPLDMDKLIVHVGGSFILASTIFRFIVQPTTEADPMTPMDRLPLTLEMNGLDSVYKQTLSRSQHLPHFRTIISTIALLVEPLSIADISALLGIKAYQVTLVLLNLQAIISVPGFDDEGVVTVCHKSLLDFLTTESRSGYLFVTPLFHLHLSYYCFATHSRAYWHLRDRHWDSFVTACDFINGIEEFKACQHLHIGRIPYAAFLCTMLFYTLFGPVSRPSSCTYLFTECAKQLALTVECPDPFIARWLGECLFAKLSGDRSEKRWGLRYSEIFLITEQLWKTLQHDLERASPAIRANFPEILKSYSSRDTKETSIVVDITRSFFPAIVIFEVLEWIVAHAHYKWEELEITPRPPLKLAMGIRHVSGSSTLAPHHSRSGKYLVPAVEIVRLTCRIERI